MQWNTRTAACTNGTQDLDTWAFRDDGSRVGNATITVEVANSSPPPPPDPEPSPCPSPVPGPVEGQGYQLRFSDCFETFSRSVWCSNQWWEPTPPLGTQYVEDGVLHLVRRRSDGYPERDRLDRAVRPGFPEELPVRLHGGSDALGHACAATARPSGCSRPGTRRSDAGRTSTPTVPATDCRRRSASRRRSTSSRVTGTSTAATRVIPCMTFTGTLHRNSCGCYDEPDVPMRLAAAAPARICPQLAHLRRRCGRH